MLKHLGAGAIGAVYLAEHVHMRKHYAVKVLHRDVATPEVVWRFRAEAIAAANIGHRGIAAATDFGELDNGSLFLVLEYVDGETLEALLERGPLPARRALRIAREILSALAAAHVKGVVHRDIKPANVMVCPGDAIKILDFGIAHLDRSRFARDDQLVTRLGLIYGSADYMAPEQASGSTVDARADLYAVGAVLYEMISGRPPFLGSPFEVIAAHRSTPPPPLAGPEPGALTREIHALVAELLAKPVDARPTDAFAAIELVDAALASLDTPRTRIAEPIPKAQRRPNRFALAVAASAVVCSSLLGVGLHRTCARGTVSTIGAEFEVPKPPKPAEPVLAPAPPPAAKPSPPPARPTKKQHSAGGLRAKLRAIFH